ncbi:DUF3489 domain-containing protein [Falsiroseomonas sp. HW251]|uniref:DUF3489 domain-containing protein n=1 Tax=Falsiroseomonas sp. HW251 TaxID=3390998 RepID=UPI003D324065
MGEATGWQQHTVRGFFAGLKKRQASRSRCWSGSARSAPTRRAPGATTQCTASTTDPR